jgi:hypothetical protein
MLPGSYPVTHNLTNAYRVDETLCNVEVFIDNEGDAAVTRERGGDGSIDSKWDRTVSVMPAIRSTCRTAPRPQGQRSCVTGRNDFVL